jgi:AcrR family transcriptional regulator
MTITRSKNGRNGSHPAARRRVGRPRADGSEPTLGPAEDILFAAAQLFAERGFIGTSTQQIAAAAGLRQSAIFHWFPSKEAILETLFARGWDRSLEYFEEVAASDLPAAVKLCLCLSYDPGLGQGANAPIQVMMVPPELRQPRFRRLLRKRERLIALVREFIRDAVRQGDFRPIDPVRAAHMVLALDETPPDAAARPAARRHAEAVVDFTLHALASDRARMARLRRLVDRHLKSWQSGLPPPRRRERQGPGARRAGS